MQPEERPRLDIARPRDARLSLTAKIVWRVDSSSSAAVNGVETTRVPEEWSYTFHTYADGPELAWVLRCWFELVNDVSDAPNRLWYD